jgi:hypothetical protein
MNPIKVTGVSARVDANNGSDVIIAFTTKYSGERTYSMPLGHLDTLISDLQRAKPATEAKSGKNSNQVTVRTPKKCVIASGLPNHSVVILVFDPQTEAQAGYAVSADAAKRMAIELVRNADTVATHEADKRGRDPNNE